MPNVPVTWLGHASFRIDTPSGKRVYVDPWLGNPKCPEGEHEPERIDVIALTHGHDDHVGETVELAKKFSARVIAMVELRGWLTAQGLEADMPSAMNKGGTVDADGTRFTMTDAKHSSSSPDGDYLGEPAGYVVTFENGTTIYIAGDTCVFGDMQLIGRIYRPEVAILPIGGHYTMDPREAAVALELLDVQTCIPCHYGTFGLLTGTPDELRENLRQAGVETEVLSPEPGETVTV